MKEVVIEVSGLNKHFGDKHVVKDFAITLKRGEVFGFLGPNGSGKTTTIRMLCGLLTPDSGQGHCLGFDIINQSSEIKNNVGYMTQRFSYYEDLSIIENLDFVARVYGLANKKQRVLNAIEQLGLMKRKHQLTGTLSGGWKQRLALAACLLHEPQLLLLDEPTAGVDPVARRDFWHTIHRLSDQGITTLVSTHFMDEAEQCSKLAYIAYGDLLVKGTVGEVIEKTHIKVWKITGQVNLELMRRLKQDKRIQQVSMFGNSIHIAGDKPELISPVIKELESKESLTITAIIPTIDDAFISLVSKAQDNFV